MATLATVARCAVVTLAATATAAAAPIQDTAGVVVVPVDTSKQSVAIFLNDGNGEPLRSFDRLAASLPHPGRRLRFAMNGGMYEQDGTPVGLLVIDRKIIHPLNRRAGKGNFFLKPNGVFAITDSGPVVVASGDYETIQSTVRYATQSGPMLLYRGQINPVLDPTWAKFTRNGVCVIRNTAFFVISDKLMSLYEFAAFFKNRIGCADALYLDGNVSSLYSERLHRYDKRNDLGPLIGVVDKSPGSGRR